MSKYEALDKEFLTKRNEDFAKECIDIFKRYAPDMSYLTMKSIICDITAVRAEMELEYSSRLLGEIEQILKDGAVNKNV